MKRNILKYITSIIALLFLSGIFTVVDAEDLYLLNTGDTGTGNYVFTGDYLYIDSAVSAEMIIDRGTTSNRAAVRYRSGGNEKWLWGLQDSSSDYTIKSYVTGDLVIDLAGGNVGIGTTSPTEKLHVQDGNVLLKTNSQYSPTLFWCGVTFNPTRESCAGFKYNGDAHKLSPVGQFQLTMPIWDGTGNKFNTGYGFGGYDGEWASMVSPSVGNMIITSSSNLDLSAGIINIRKDSSNANWVTFDSATEKVGIGKTNPNWKLDVNGVIKGSQYRSSTGNDDWNFGIGLDTYEPNDFMFRNTAGTERFRIKENGNVGIGASNPGNNKLYVQGNGYFNGELRASNIAAHYQDLAEWVPTSTPLTSATVVMINPTEINHVLPSDKEYNTLVAGVVSEQPGISLGVPGEGKAQIAHTGRVKVKVDTNYGGIAIGDLLVTSPIEGHAMKADNSKLRPGMLLGKALQPLAEGQQGEILVLLTLQ